jgi:hypothetical protein
VLKEEAWLDPDGLNFFLIRASNHECVLLNRNFARCRVLSSVCYAASSVETAAQSIAQRDVRRSASDKML